MPNRTMILFVAAVVALPCSASRAEKAKVRLRWIDGRTVELAGVSFLPGWKVTGTNESGPVEVPATDLIAIDFDATRESVSSRHPAILLSDGQLLHGEILAADDDSLLVKNSLAGEVRLPLLTIEGVLLTTGLGKRAKQTAAAEIRRVDRVGDAIVLANEDVLVGTIEQFGPEEWKIRKDGDTRTVRSELVRGVALDPTLLDYKTPEGLSARVRLNDGSVLAVRSLRSTPGGLQLETAVGPVLSVTADAVTNIAIRGGRGVYLSDMTPLKVDTRGFLDDVPRPRMDENVLGAPLSLGGTPCEKGIGTRGYTRIDYNVEGFHRLIAKIGVDDGASESASVVFRILLDDKVALDSGEMTPATDAREIDVDLKGAKVASLIVDFGDRGDVGDAADWCEARLVK